MADFFLMQNKIELGLPDGATVTPVDDYVIWLRCAGLPNTYGSLANVIADTTAMEILRNNVNALRYMVRSISTIQPAVLANASWVTALKSSIYAVFVPTMTSNTVPNGEVIYSTFVNATYSAWKAFDGDDATPWFPIAGYATWGGQYLGYKDTKSVFLFGGDARFSSNLASPVTLTYKIQCSTDGSAWTDISGNLTRVIASNNDTLQSLGAITAHSVTGLYHRLLAISQSAGSPQGAGIWTMQFYSLDLS